MNERKENKISKEIGERQEVLEKYDKDKVKEDFPETRGLGDLAQDGLTYLSRYTVIQNKMEEAKKEYISRNGSIKDKIKKVKNDFKNWKKISSQMSKKQELSTIKKVGEKLNAKGIIKGFNKKKTKNVIKHKEQLDHIRGNKEISKVGKGKVNKLKKSTEKLEVIQNSNLYKIEKRKIEKFNFRQALKSKGKGIIKKPGQYFKNNIMSDLFKQKYIDVSKIDLRKVKDIKLKDIAKSTKKSIGNFINNKKADFKSPKKLTKLGAWADIIYSGITIGKAVMTGDKEKIAESTVGVAGMFAGGSVGEFLGGAIGTLIAPGVGTAIGAAAGNLVGSIVGEKLGNFAGKFALDILDDPTKNTTKSNITKDDFKKLGKQGIGGMLGLVNPVFGAIGNAASLIGVKKIKEIFQDPKKGTKNVVENLKQRGRNTFNFIKNTDYEKVGKIVGTSVGVVSSLITRKPYNVVKGYVIGKNVGKSINYSIKNTKTAYKNFKKKVNTTGWRKIGNRAKASAKIAARGIIEIRKNPLKIKNAVMKILPKNKKKKKGTKKLNRGRVRGNMLPRININDLTAKVAHKLAYNTNLRLANC